MTDLSRYDGRRPEPPYPTDAEGTREALAELMALIEDGWLVRNTTNDHHMPSYLSESVRLVKALAKARAALARTEQKGNTP